jgi:hypothetical protein
VNKVDEMATTSELIRWSIQQSVDHYSHIVRRRMHLLDNEESTEKVRNAPKEVWYEYLTNDEIGRLNEYETLLLNWGE